jgi:predicted RNase H-like nuclease (RuvC/YqgF family)
VTALRNGVAREELERRRERIARELAEEQWDLGGLTYEMAIRDHFRLDVLTRKAARLQELDAQLASIERLLKMESEGAAGACHECGALHARGASFCWQCGAGLTETLPAR